MPARIDHVAICSDHDALNGRFYEALFGMKPSSKPRPARSVVLGDGYVGMNLIPRRDGRTSGLDYFGIEVELRLPSMEAERRKRRCAVEMVMRRMAGKL